MKTTIQLTATLTVIATVAGLSIGATYLRTSDIINQQKTQQLNSALESLFPDGVEISQDSLIRSDNSVLPFWTAKQPNKGEGNLVGFAFESGGRGYSSTIRYLAAISADNKIIGMTVLSQEETPGLGTRVMETVSKATFWNGLFAKREKTEPWFQSQFRNISVLNPIGISKKAEWHTLSKDQKAELLSKNEVTAITGATITTKAITDAITTESKTVSEINEFLASKKGGLQ